MDGASESIARVAMARTASPDELATLIPRRSPVGVDAATEYFEEEKRDASARRRFNIFVALASIGAACASVGLTTDMIGHTAKFRAAMQSPRLGAGRWTSLPPLPPWTPNVPPGEVNTPALAFAEMDRVKLEGSALEAAKRWSHEDSFPTFPASRYLDGEERVRRKLETPVYVIAIAGDAKDQARTSKLVSRFDKTFDFGGKGARKGDTNGTKDGFVQIQDAVNAEAWPKTIELAEEAVETLHRLRPLSAPCTGSPISRWRRSGPIECSLWVLDPSHITSDVCFPTRACGVCTKSLKTSGPSSSRATVCGISPFPSARFRASSTTRPPTPMSSF